jgi:Arc/MetJ family transcription regulator
MKITLTLPDELVNDAMHISGAKTKNELITIALDTLIKNADRIQLLACEGKIDLNIDLDVLRDRN